MEITCPVSQERVNENGVRVVAAFVVLIATVAILLNNYWLFLLLTTDFFSRTFLAGRGSLLKLVSSQLVKVLHLGSKPTDAAPKKFAAGMGFGFSLMIAALLFAEFHLAALLLSGALIACAILESAAGICVGCTVYYFAVLPFRTASSR